MNVIGFSKILIISDWGRPYCVYTCDYDLLGSEDTRVLPIQCLFP